MLRHTGLLDKLKWKGKGRRASSSSSKSQPSSGSDNTILSEQERWLTHVDLFGEEAESHRQSADEQGGGSGAMEDEQGGGSEAMDVVVRESSDDEGDDEARDERLAREAENAEQTARCPYRLRRHLLCTPSKDLDQRRIIKPKGTRCWIEPGWDGRGRRRKVNTELGNAIRFCFPGMVLVGGQRVAAHSWDHYTLKPYGRSGTCQDRVWEMFWQLFRLAEGSSEAYARFVFENAARRLAKDSFSDARIKAVTVFYKTKLLQPMTNKKAKKIHLEKEQYLQSYVDWVCADREAWEWFCEYWASEEFKLISNRNRRNRTNRPGMHRYGPDGHVGMSQRMEAETGATPTFMEVYLKGHRGTDPTRPEELCDTTATEKVAKYRESLKKAKGDEVDWVKEPFDVGAAYEAGGGLPHGRIGLGDGYVEREAYSRRSSTAGSSRSRSTAETDELREELRKTREVANNAKQMVDQMHFMLMSQMLAQRGNIGSQFGVQQQTPSPTQSGQPVAASSQFEQMSQLLAQAGIGSQFGMPPFLPQQFPPPMQPRQPAGSSSLLEQMSQGSETGQAYSPLSQGLLAMLGIPRPGGQASTGVLPLMPFGPCQTQPPPPPPAPGSRHGTPENFEGFLNWSGASGGGSNHNMEMD